MPGPDNDEHGGGQAEDYTGDGTNDGTDVRANCFFLGGLGRKIITVVHAARDLQLSCWQLHSHADRRCYLLVALLPRVIKGR